MSEIRRDGTTLVTGADGQIGRAVCRQLRESEARFLPVDKDPAQGEGVLQCDLRNKDDIFRLFHSHAIETVIHLAAILPTAFRADPLLGADVNLTGTFELMRQAVNAQVKRFVFASSRSVYGLSSTLRSLTETDVVNPEDPYGAAKRAVELVGEALHATQTMEFVSLRVAIVVGPGVRKSSSTWRSQMFAAAPGAAIKIPFASSVLVPLAYVEDVAREFIILAQAARLASSAYNTPVEIWKVADLKVAVERSANVYVQLENEGTHGGPLCDGGRFVEEFGFRPQSIRERLQPSC
jgi:nucleoside-diphosphate-sugar epimerase